MYFNSYAKTNVEFFMGRTWAKTIDFAYSASVN